MDTESRAYRLWCKYMNVQHRNRPEQEFSAGYIPVTMAEELYRDGVPTPISGDATTCKRAWLG